MAKLFALLGIVVLVLAIAVGVRTVTLPSRQLVVAAARPVDVDAAAVAARLGAAVRFKTVAMADDEDANAAEFTGLHTLLETSFPKLHAKLKREAIGKFGLLYTWAGTDPAAPPIGLMAHQDVVPIAPGTEKDWEQPPFSGNVANGYIWGRGSWDDKGSLMSVMEAVEMLVASGFTPRQTIYLMFGQDEEIHGARGAGAIVKLLQQRGVRLQFVLDEGLPITIGVLPGLEKPAALIGLAEKGTLDLRLTATGVNGHSSMPPPEAGQSAIGMMSAALAKLETHQMPLAVQGLSREMFETLAPEMVGANRVFLSNLWLFRPVVEWQLSKGASTNAAMRTTTALTVFNAGNADNVLPGRSNAVVNFRTMPGDSSDAVIEHVRQVIANPAITIVKGEGSSEASNVARTDAAGYQLIERTMRQLHPDVIVGPGLMIGGTDSHYFDAISDSVYKFLPVRATTEDLKRFHGTNERLAVANYVELIQFYHQLIGNAQPAL